MTGERLRGFDPHITDPTSSYSLTSFIHNAQSVHLPYGQAQGYNVIIGCLQVAPWDRIHEPDHPYLLEYLGSLEPVEDNSGAYGQQKDRSYYVGNIEDVAGPVVGTYEWESGEERDIVDYGGHGAVGQYRQQSYALGYHYQYPQTWRVSGLPPISAATEYQDPFYVTPHYFPEY